MTNAGPEYGDLLTAVKARVRSAQYAALKAVNTEQGASIADRLSQGHARRIPRHQRLFQAQRFLYAGILPVVPGR